MIYNYRKLGYAVNTCSKMHKLVVLLLIATTSDNIVVRNLYTTKITPKLPPIFCIIDTVNGLTDTNSMIITMMDNIYQTIYIYTRLVKEISSRMSRKPKSIRRIYIYIYKDNIYSRQTKVSLWSF